MIVPIDEYREFLYYSGFRQNIETVLATWNNQLLEFHTPPHFRTLKKALHTLFIDSFRRTPSLCTTSQIHIELSSLLRDIIGISHQSSLNDPDYRESLQSICLLMQYYFRYFKFPDIHYDAAIVIVRETVHHLLQLECLALTTLNFFATSPVQPIFQEIMNPLFYEVGGVEGGAAYQLTHQFFRRIRDQIQEAESKRTPFYPALENKSLAEKWRQETRAILSFLDLLERSKSPTRPIYNTFTPPPPPPAYPENYSYYEQPPSSEMFLTPMEAYPATAYEYPTYGEQIGAGPVYAEEYPSTYPQESSAPQTEAPPEYEYRQDKPYGLSTEFSIPIPESLKTSVPAPAPSSESFKLAKNVPAPAPSSESFKLASSPSPSPSPSVKAQSNVVIQKQQETFKKAKKNYGEKQDLQLIFQKIEQLFPLTVEAVEQLFQQYEIGVEIVPNLISFLTQPKTQAIFETVLKNLCKKNPEILFPFLQSENSSILISVCRILSGASSHQVFQVLLPLLQHPRGEIRNEAANTLFTLFPRESTDLFLTKLSDPQEQTRKLALEHLPKTENKQLYFKILSIIESSDFDQKELSEKRGFINAFALCGQQAAIGKLKEILDQRLVTKILRKDAMNKQIEIKKCAVRALGYIRDETVVSILKQIEQSKNSELSLLAKISLSEREKWLQEEEKSFKKD